MAEGATAVVIIVIAVVVAVALNGGDGGVCGSSINESTAAVDNSHISLEHFKLNFPRRQVLFRWI